MATSAGLKNKLGIPPTNTGSAQQQPPATPGYGAPQNPNPYDNSPTGPSKPYNPSSASPVTGNYGTSVGGQSAVNPNASAIDYESLNKFIDPAYQQAMQRLTPQMEAQSRKFDQDMTNRGIGVGTEAYNKALQQIDFNQNDARQSAAFNAMQFGTGIQQQMFGQDAQRSQLANALLQAQMGNQLGYAGLNQAGEQFFAGLNEGGRQYDNNFNQNQQQWNDASNYQWDRAQMNDLGWLANFDRQGQQYNDQQDWNYFNANQGLLGAIPGWNPAQIDVNGSANAASNSQYGQFNAQNAMNQQAWSQITDVLGMGAMAMGSDARLKDNVEKVGEINGLNIYKWTWNKIAQAIGIGKQPTIGVIAQEVPQAYVTMKDGYLAVNYEGLFNASY